MSSLYIIDGQIYAQTQDEDPVISDFYHIEAYRLAPGEEFVLDGNMDEPFWENVQPITNFRQQDPHEGAVPSERTEIYVAFDDDNLYIAAKLYDTSLAGILAYQKRRNQSLETDDRFMWILDTFNDGRNAYFFETNPAGLRGDGLLTVGQGYNLNKAWDGIWDVQTSITNEGWIAKVIIPFRSLDFNSENTSWGINFQRTVRRHNEEIVWSGWRRNQGLFRPQNAGTISGLTGISQGIGLEFKPYLSTSGNRTWLQQDEREDNGTMDIGFDASYSITPSVRASLTINTDFAETEVDQRRVNLTRFPLQFPEQRSFFLEGASIFSFAPASGITPFFSRRIGLMEGEPISVNGGLRVLGREGNTNLGLYQIRTGSEGEINQEDFTAARISQNLFSESNIGLIYTRRATLDDDLYNNRHTLGADMELGTSSFLGDKNLQFQAFFVWHNTHTTSEESNFWDKTSRGMRINFPNYPFYGWMSYREFGNSFNPAVGFTPRNTFRRWQPTVGYRQFLNRSNIIRSLETEAYFEYLMNLDFEPETVLFRLTPIKIEFESGDQVTASFSRNFERLYTGFDILRNERVIVPPGDYKSWSFKIELNTAPYRVISSNSELTHEGFWTGTRNIYGISGTIRPYAGINLSADWIRSDVTLPEYHFTTDLILFRSDIDLSPNTAFTNIVQFDDLSDILGFFNRFRWTITPGSDMYLVYSHNWVQIDDRFEPIETQGAVKINYTHRF
ncbi:MAG: carbohydrate binding family 9 domain-containing protein [Balneolaceae bacterium]|nr:carbohydrate binding family 9 domain-containing protein [Balneolaceae bacterium]